MRYLPSPLIVLLVAGVFGLAGCDPQEPDPDPNPPSPDFLTALKYPVGNAPLSVRTADFNGDGKLDIVTANRGSNNISVLLSRETRGYELHRDLPAGTAPTSLVVANVIGSPLLDIICVNTDSGDLSIFEGLPDGAFNAAVRLGLLATAAPLDAAVADFDGDGDNDIVTADSGTNSVSLLTNNGGSFDPIPAIFPVGASPRAVLAVDLNKDGKPDLVAVNRNSNNVSILLNDGAGSLLPAVHVPVGNNPRQAEAIDVDKDNDLDLVVTSPTGKTVDVLLNDGAGGFAQGVSIPTDGLPSRCDSADFNGDGIIDLAVVMFSEAEGNPALGVTDIFYGNGTGSFSTVRRFGLGGAAQDLVVADVTGDSRPDIVAADAGGNAVAVLAGRPGGAFATDERIPVGRQPREVIAADLDNDSDLDLVVIAQTDKTITTFKNNGGVFSTGNIITLTGTPRGLAVGHVNGDGFLDVAVSEITGSEGVRIFFGKGDGTLLNAGGNVPLPGRDPRAVVIGDVNKDGKADIVTADSRQDEISVALGDGAGVFSTPAHFKCGNFPLHLHLHDVNSDGNPDLLFISRNDPDLITDQAEPRVVRMLGRGDGTFEESGLLRVATGADPRDMAMGDISGDGKPDAVVASAIANAAFTHIVPASGAVQVGVSRRGGTGPRAIVLPDIGGDNKRDIVTINGDDTFTVISNMGSGAWLQTGTYPAGDNAIEGATGDFNKDGRPDLVLVNQGTGDLSIVFGSA
jgi:hypothetical protein